METSIKGIIIGAVIAGAFGIIKSIINQGTVENSDHKIKAERISKVVFATILIIGVTNALPGPSKRVAKVYNSYISYYVDANPDFEPFEEFYETDTAEIETERAFSIISDVRNDGEKSSSIEKIRCDILDLKPIEKPLIRMDAEIVENTLKLFAFNDGWGNSYPLKITTAVIYEEESENFIADFNTIAQCTYMAENPSLESGDAVLLAEYKLDSAKFIESFECGDCDLLTKNK